MAMNNAVPRSHFLSVASPFSVNLIILGDSAYVQWKAILVVEGVLCFSTNQCYVMPPPQHLIASCSHWSYEGRCFFLKQFLFCSFSSQNSVGTFCQQKSSLNLHKESIRCFKTWIFLTWPWSSLLVKVQILLVRDLDQVHWVNFPLILRRTCFSEHPFDISCLMHIFWLRIHWICKHNWHLLSPELVGASSTALTTPKWNQSDIPQNNIHVAHAIFSNSRRGNLRCSF